MTWQEFLCLVGFHERGYKFEHTPFEEHGRVKDKVSLIRYCPYCPNGRKVIVDRSLLLGD